MVSLIQECLGEVFHGSLIGRLMYASLGNTIRQDVMTEARLIITFPYEEVVRTNRQYIHLWRAHC